VGRRDGVVIVVIFTVFLANPAVHTQGCKRGSVERYVFPLSKEILRSYFSLFESPGYTKARVCEETT
jgi:hypothetical protein